MGMLHKAEKVFMKNLYNEFKMSGILIAYFSGGQHFTCHAPNF